MHIELRQQAVEAIAFRMLIRSISAIFVADGNRFPGAKALLAKKMRFKKPENVWGMQIAAATDVGIAGATLIDRACPIGSSVTPKFAKLSLSILGSSTWPEAVEGSVVCWSFSHLHWRKSPVGLSVFFRNVFDRCFLFL